MITAKYSGICKVTGVKIEAGSTLLEKINGVWQVAPHLVPTGQYTIQWGNQTPHLATNDEASDFVYRIEQSKYGRDVAADLMPFMFAVAGTQFKNQWGDTLTVNWATDWAAIHAAVDMSPL